MTIRTPPGDRCSGGSYLCHSSFAMHPRNRYRDKHDFRELSRLSPELDQYLTVNATGKLSLDFTQRRALLLLNRTLLLRDYGLTHWDIPADHLVPPLPGRLDYIHALADLVPDARRIMDVGTGASAIYPILGVREYGWEFVGTEVNPQSVKVAEAIVRFTPSLRGKVAIRLQKDRKRMLDGVVGEGEHFDAIMCNPPFYESREEAERAGSKKWKKLGRTDSGLSFGGADSELWTEGGEPAFLRRMIAESRDYHSQVGWFTTLVSKRGYLQPAHQQLDRLAAEVRVIPLEQGNKKSRILAWRYET